MGKLDDPFFGNIPPDATVKLVFNLSQDEDGRGPWNEEPDFDYVADPQPEGGLPPPPVNADDEGHNAQASKRRNSKPRGCTQRLVSSPSVMPRYRSSARRPAERMPVLMSERDRKMAVARTEVVGQLPQLRAKA